MTKVGHHVLGIKGSIQDRKGYVVHVENDNDTWIMLENGTVVTGVPSDAFKGRRGRPVQVHSVVAGKRTVYSESIAGSHQEMKTQVGEPANPATRHVYDAVAYRREMGGVLLWDGEKGHLPPIEVLQTPTVKPRLKIVGEDGNAFNLIGLAVRAGKRAGWTKDQIDGFRQQAMGGDYDQLLATIARYFELVDEDEEEDFE